jgi:hypothetical protein
MFSTYLHVLVVIAWYPALKVCICVAYEAEIAGLQWSIEPVPHAFDSMSEGTRSSCASFRVQQHYAYTAWAGAGCSEQACNKARSFRHRKGAGGSMRSAACVLQHAFCSMRSAACVLQHAFCSMRSAALKDLTDQLMHRCCSLHVVVVSVGSGQSCSI